jgi:lipase
MTPRGSDKFVWHDRPMTNDLHVYRYGPAGAIQVLAIHGLTGHGKRWESLANGHLSDVTIAAPDLIGHGRSSWDAPWTIDANVDALAALLDADGGQPVVAVGHSFGGAIALNLAAARPDLVDSLVLLDPATGLDGHRMREIADDMIASPDYTDREEARSDKLSGSWGEVPEADLDAELDEHLVPWPNGRVGWRLSLPAMMSYWSELTRPIALPRSGTPTTLLRATKTDPPYVTDGLVTALRDSLGPDFNLVDIDCDHMVPLARPDETAAAVRARL